LGLYNLLDLDLAVDGALSIDEVEAQATPDILSLFPREVPFRILHANLPHTDKDSDSFPHDQYHLYLIIDAAFVGMQLQA
jgi:hypothetical protein